MIERLGSFGGLIDNGAKWTCLHEYLTIVRASIIFALQTLTILQAFGKSETSFDVIERSQNTLYNW